MMLLHCVLKPVEPNHIFSREVLVWNNGWGAIFARSFNQVPQVFDNLGTAIPMKMLNVIKMKMVMFVLADTLSDG